MVFADQQQARLPRIMRGIGWVNLALMTAFLINVVLTFWVGLNGASLSGSWVGVLQFALYPLAMILGLWFVLRTPTRSLREDSFRVSDMNTFFIRACFWIVLLVGGVDVRRRCQKRIPLR